jgi:hypothetical protein
VATKAGETGLFEVHRGGTLAGMIRFLLPLIATALFSGAIGQSHGQAGGGEPAPPGLQLYSSPELHLTFAYPTELGPVDTAFAVTAARRMIYGEDSESDPEQGANCSKVLLAAGEGIKGKAQWIRVALVEVNGQCFPPRALQNKKAMQILLRNLVRQGTTRMGMMPIEQPTGYEVGGRWAAFGAAQGEPVSNTDLQTSEPQLLGLVAVQGTGCILAWVIETDAAAMFNRLLQSQVNFGSGKPESLVPAQVK